jgi:hypothetical protein
MIRATVANRQIWTNGEGVAGPPLDKFGLQPGSFMRLLIGAKAEDEKLMGKRISKKPLKSAKSSVSKIKCFGALPGRSRGGVSYIYRGSEKRQVRAPGIQSCSFESTSYGSATAILTHQQQSGGTVSENDLLLEAINTSQESVAMKMKEQSVGSSSASAINQPKSAVFNLRALEEIDPCEKARLGRNKEIFKLKQAMKQELGTLFEVMTGVTKEKDVRNLKSTVCDEESSSIKQSAGNSSEPLGANAGAWDDPVAIDEMMDIFFQDGQVQDVKLDPLSQNVCVKPEPLKPSSDLFKIEPSSEIFQNDLVPSYVKAEPGMKLESSSDLFKIDWNAAEVFTIESSLESPEFAPITHGIVHQGVAYDVGDDITLRNPTGGLPFVGTITQIKEAGARITVQWYYRPTDIPKKILKMHLISMESNELMKSAHSDDNSPESFMGKITVHTKNVTKNDFFVRYSYNPSKIKKPFGEL